MTKKEQEKDKFMEYINETNSRVYFVGTIDERIEELKEELRNLKETKKEKEKNTHMVMLNDNFGLNITLQGTKDLEKYKTYINNPIQNTYKQYIDNSKKIFWSNIANMLNKNKEIQWKDICIKYDVTEETINRCLKDTKYIKKRKR